jgi:8-amino-3,8-dideoxy-alpha-D-manno-octulosonate transaminase
MGDIGVFSFQFHKTITAGEGGMVVTDDALLYERSVRMHDLGQLRPYHRRQAEPEVVPFAGSQFRMSELTAAMALAQLRKLDGIRRHCRSMQHRVMDQIRDLPGLEFRRIPDATGDSGFEIYLFLRDAEQAQGLRQKLHDLNVNCQPGTGTGCHVNQQYCIHAQAHAASASPFAKFKTWPVKGYRPEDFPRTLSLAARFISLPIGVLYTEDDADYIAACVRQAYCELI